MTTNETGDLLSAGVEQVLDVGCGVASFAAYLLPLGIKTMYFTPKDGHELCHSHQCLLIWFTVRDVVLIGMKMVRLLCSSFCF